MTPAFPAAKNLAAKLAVLLAAVAVVAAGLAITPADAAKRKVHDYDGGVVAYSSRGPNVSYQSGPRTRVYVTKRSWLDPGVEVLPGARKFTHFPFPHGPSSCRSNPTR